MKNSVLKDIFVRPFDLRFFEEKPEYGIDVPQETHEAIKQSVLQQFSNFKTFVDNGEDLINSILNTNDINEIKDLATKLKNTYNQIINTFARFEIDVNRL